MYLLSFTHVALLLAQLSACVPQVLTPVAITGPTSAASSCGGCYLVADVAGIEFGTETITHTQLGAISVGLNATATVITTAVVATVAPFSYDTSGLISPNTGTLIYYTGSTITVNGVALTSPTAYDVFTAYSITSTAVVNGVCSVVEGPPIPLSSAFSFVRIPGVAGVDQQAELAFIKSIGGLTCSAGGVNLLPSTAIPVVLSTTYATMPRSFAPTAIPQVTVASSIASSTSGSSTTSTSASPTSTSSVPTSTVSSKSLPTSTLSSSSSRSISSSSTTPSRSSMIVVPPLSSVPSPTTTSSLPSSQGTSTLTTAISVAAIIPLPQNSTTLTSTISVGTIVVVGNSTFLPTGYAGPTFTIITSPGSQAANWRTEIVGSWAPWIAVVLSTLITAWAL